LFFDKTNKIIKLKTWEGRSYLVGGYRLPSFFATYKMKDESISTRSLKEDSSFERSTIDFVVPRSRKTFDSSNAFSP
jgi:hypothetical protein